MSYDPSHRMPPRQERWPHATPAEGWPSYRDAEAEQADRRSGTDRMDAYPAAAGYRGQDGYQHAFGESGERGHQAAVATAAFPAAGNDYGSAGYGSAGYGDTWDGYDGTADGYGGNGYGQNGYGPGGDGHGGASHGYAGTANGYAGTVDGYSGVTDGFDGAVDGYARSGGGYTSTDGGYTGADGGYGQGAGEYAGDVNGYDWNATSYAGDVNDFARAQDGFAGGAYLGPGSYIEPGLADTRSRADTRFRADLMLTAPDAGVYPENWQADQQRRREASRRGLMVGAATEILAVAVVIGVSTLAAALLRSATSPVSALAAVFIDRTPAALRNVALQHFGAEGRTVLLLGMYATFAVVAMVIGGLARRAPALGVAGIGAFTLFAAFAVITRPASHVGDVMPAVVGGVAGVAALLWLFRASAPIAPLGHARNGARRRTR